jgi:hypothetical protein
MAEDKNGAGFQFSTRTISPNGTSHLVVWRAAPTDSPEDDIAGMFSAMNMFEAAMADHGYKPLTNSFSGQDVISQKPRDPQPSRGASGSRSTGTRPAATGPDPDQFGGPPPEGAEQPGGGVNQATRDAFPDHESLGVGRLTKVVTESKGDGKIRIGFHMSNRQKAIYEQRGPEIAATLFRDGCFNEDFTAAMLAEVDEVYTEEKTWKTHMQVLSGKGRYWDVLVIKPA